MNFVSHLECANCQQHYDAGKVHNHCTSCQRPLLVRYHLDALKKSFSKKALFGRPSTIWRYLEMPPMRDPAKIVSLTETITPILESKRLAAHFGAKHVCVKDESRLPTGSFKARGMALAISKAREFGIQRVAFWISIMVKPRFGHVNPYAELEPRRTEPRGFTALTRRTGGFRIHHTGELKPALRGPLQWAK